MQGNREMPQALAAASIQDHTVYTLMAGNVSSVFTEQWVSSTQAVTNYERRASVTRLNFIKL